jgi:hypothetical protein
MRKDATLIWRVQAYKHLEKRDKQCMYKVKLWRVRIGTVAV